MIFSTCKPVKGAKRSIICNLVRNSYEFIPNEMFDFISIHHGQTVRTIMSQYPSHQRVISEYIDFLLDKEFAFLCDMDELEFFPELDLSWEYPAEVTNGIIDIDMQSNHDFCDIFKQFEDLGCKHLLIRSFTDKNILFWENILCFVQDSKFKSIDIINKYSADITSLQLSELIANNGRIRSIIFSSSTFENVQTLFGCTVIFTKTPILSNQHCGYIAPKYFTVNNSLFFESQNNNNCLNRKISIDASGLIKNCPSMQNNYGKISEMRLADILNSEMFKSYWNIKKDIIDTCKVCEFRYICTDCRAFVMDHQLSKPAKCKYDPYTAAWAD